MYSQHWGFSIQQQMPKEFVMQVGYTANNAHKILSRTYINLINPATGKRPWSKFGRIDSKEDAGNGSFNALQVSVKRPREGIAIYARPDGTGYLLCTDQLPGASEYRVYRREGKAGKTHDHSEVVKILRGPADSTDGLEATSVPLGPRFPRGLLVAMNSGGKNFLVFSFPEF